MVLGAMDLPSPISPAPTAAAKPLLPNPSPLLKHPPGPPHAAAGAGAGAGAAVVYRECLKNHAASIGGHALDGCGEFMASPAAVASDPTSLKCAACGCHRNFHRRHHHHQFLLRHRSPRSPSPGPTPSPQSPPPVSHLPPAQMLLALGGESAHARKRFRTKFSQEQKEKMWAFAERVGWKMQRSEEKLVERFCDEIGVRRGVLKVWMHNNKHSRPKRDRPPCVANNNNVVAANSISNDDDDDDDVDVDVDDEDHPKSNLNNFFANGSSSSS